MHYPAVCADVVIASVNLNHTGAELLNTIDVIAEHAVVVVADWLDMAVILPWLLGMALIVLTLARVVNWCFRAHYPLFYHAVFGIVLASTVVIIPLHYDGARDALLCLLAAALGALAAYLSAKLQPKEDA